MTLFESNTDSADPIYGQLRGLVEQRAFADRLLNQFEPYSDENFVSEFAQHCISRYWQMYLGCALLDGGFKLVPRKYLPEAGPDFCIAKDDSRVWIEAVTINAGTGPDSLAPVKDEPEDRARPPRVTQSVSAT